MQTPINLPPGTVSWVETDLAALRENLDAFRCCLEKTSRLIAVVKSNAYGHGLEPVAKTLSQAGADGFAVVNLGEGLAMREYLGPGETILVLGMIPHRDLALAVENDLQPTIYDQQSVTLLGKAAQAQRTTARVHIKIETGTNRQGIRGEQLDTIIRTIGSTPAIDIAGVSTHFADIEDTTDHAFALAQMKRFHQTVDQADWPSETPPRHAACSAAAILFPETHLELVRVGIGLYGLWPSRETLVAARERGISNMQLAPVMTWKALLAQVKHVPAGEYVSYGRTWRATRDSRIAVLPIGYFDGYPRALSDKGHVIVHGKRARVVGRVCMNMTMVDVTDIPQATVGDVAILIGQSGEETLTAEELASWAGTIHYEIVSRIHPALPRIPV